MNKMLARGLALAAGLTIWAFASLRGSGQEALQATVRFQNVPPGLEINPDQIESISVLVQGPRDRLRALTSKGVVVAVDCKDVYAAGERTVNVDAVSLNLPRNVTFVKAVPSQVRFTLEERAEKLVEVAPQFVGEIPPGYVLDGYTVDPPELIIAGPSARVALIEQVSTDPISLAGEVGTRSFRTRAFLADPYLRFAGDAAVNVEVHMRTR